jgi:hypothetical protein
MLGELPAPTRLRTDSSPMAGGKIQVLDLKSIRDRLGSKWPRMSHLVHRYFEAAIKNELLPGDCFATGGELEYLVAFRDVSLAEARLKCLAISQFVCDRLFGKDAEELIVRNLIAPLDPTDLTFVDDVARANEMLEEHGEEVFCNHTGERPKSPPRRILSVSLGDERRHQMSATQPPFVYRPFWDSEKQVVLSYLAQPFPETCGVQTRFHVPAVALPLEPAQCELDMLCLMEARRRMRMIRGAGGRLLVFVPLHFQTMSRQRYWALYRDAISALASNELTDLRFLIYGIDAGVPNVRLIQELPKLSAYIRGIFCLCADAALVHRQFNNTGIQAVGLAARPGEPEHYFIERLGRLHAATRSAGIESFVLGVTRRSTVVNAIGAGVRYIEGGGMRTAVADPRFAVAQDIVDYYRLPMISSATLRAS